VQRARQLREHVAQLGRVRIDVDRAADVELAERRRLLRVEQHGDDALRIDLRLRERDRPHEPRRRMVEQRAQRLDRPVRVLVGGDAHVAPEPEVPLHVDLFAERAQ
jgi:hypothetical protein